MATPSSGTTRTPTRARTALRPDTVATIRAAQNVWLASEFVHPRDRESPELEQEIDAFINLLLDQALIASRRA
jgi:hypothetical protein